MSTNFTFQLPFIPQAVVVFGCGGTGSRLIPPIAQLMSKLPTLVAPEMVLVDFDVVEEKNLDRQNFAKPDVGKNKASALASRYSKAYNLKITPIEVAAGTKEYGEALQMFGVQPRLEGPTLYIIAVDSAEARRSILKSALTCQRNSSHASVIIDCGNEDIFGQVSYFTTGKLSSSAAKDLEFINNWYQGVIPGEHILTELPVDAQAYADMQEGQSTKSCADLDQTLAINNIMAAQAVVIAQNVLMGKPMRYWRVNFDLFNGVTYDTISIPELLKRSDRDVAGEKRDLIHSIRRGVQCSSALMDPVLTDLSSKLENEMLAEDPVTYNMSKMVRESLNLPKFVPSLIFKDQFPEFYTEQYINMWNEGYVLPEATEEDRRTYEIAARIFAEMKAEAEAAARPTPAPTAVTAEPVAE